MSNERKWTRQRVEQAIDWLRTRGEVVDLSGEDLGSLGLRNANLSGADLSGADLSGAVLSGADLSEAKLSEAKLYRADLSGADLRWADLRWADLSGADLSEAKLYRADLSEAVLSEANLTRSDLDHIKLIGATVSFSDLWLVTEILSRGHRENNNKSFAIIAYGLRRYPVLCWDVLDDPSYGLSDEFIKASLEILVKWVKPNQELPKRLMQAFEHYAIEF